MKFVLRNILLTLAGLLVMILTHTFRTFLPALAYKFLLLAGCALFGYGIAMIIHEKKTPR